MIPTTVLGLVVLAAALGPGYVFVRVEERRRARPARSALLETAELIVIGGFASTTAFAVVAALAAHWGWLNETQLAKDSSHYLLSHVTRVAGLVLVTLALSYVGAYLVALALFRHRPATIKLHSAWDEVFTPKAGVIHYATVGLDDGLAVAGDVVGHSVGERPADDRELVLADPEVRAPGEPTFRRTREPLVILRGDRIRTLSVIPYEGVLPASERPRTRRDRLSWRRRQRNATPSQAGQTPPTGSPPDMPC